MAEILENNMLVPNLHQVTLAIASVLGATGYNVYYKAGSTSATTADTKAFGSPFISLNLQVSPFSKRLVVLGDLVCLV